MRRATSFFISPIIIQKVGQTLFLTVQVLKSDYMGILESLAIIFFALFLVGLIISIVVWLTWLFLILAIIMFVIRLILKIRKWIKKISLKNT